MIRKVLLFIAAIVAGTFVMEVLQNIGADVWIARGSGLAPVEWTPHKRECSSWEEHVGSSLLSTRTRP